MKEIAGNQHHRSNDLPLLISTDIGREKADRYKKLKLSLNIKYSIYFILAAILINSIPKQCSATVWDMKTDWSQTSNPNGAWTYRAGTKILGQYIWYAGLPTSVPSWGDFFPLSQPSRLPAWFLSTYDPDSGLDWKAGDIIVHTQDDLNGGGNSQANVMWTSPITGTINISGNAWLGGDIGRAASWNIYKNDILISSGAMFSGDSYDRAHPFTFDLGTGGASALQNINVVANDRITMEIARNGVFGWFVGSNLTITSVNAPEPFSIYYVLTGTLTLLHIRKRI